MVSPAVGRHFENSVPSHGRWLPGSTFSFSLVRWRRTRLKSGNPVVPFLGMMRSCG